MMFAILGLSALLQLFATGIAMQQMTRVSGRYRLAWGCVSLALALMVLRRLGPLGCLLETGEEPHALHAVFGLVVSLCMAAGLWGIRSLFADMRRQKRRLDQMARTDMLTGLPNRREILDRLRAELARVERTGRPLSLLMIDIDHFKTVNDSYGHAAGDDVLKTMAKAIESSMRRIDCCGRLGGEEFLVVLPESSGENAERAAERVREAIAACVCQTERGPLHVTISIGVSTQSAQEPVVLEELLRVADAALYAAKAAGRNQVSVASTA